MKYTLLILISSLSISCNSQGEKENADKLENMVDNEITTPVGQYVTDVFEDSKGDLWFGTLEKGIAKYDGEQLRYFTKTDGLPSNRVTGILEDSKGVFWLKTGEGLSKFDGKNFMNFLVGDDFYSNMISQLFIDSKGDFWVGTWGGVYTFSGGDFVHFPLPYPIVETKINEDTKNWITDITEDSDGNIWFARDGYGACKYDGESFIHFRKKEGLHSNYVTEIEIDIADNVWFGTRVAEKDNPDPKKRFGKGGVNKLIHDVIVDFPGMEGLSNGDVYEVYIDNSNDVWMCTQSNGVYRFDGEEFKNYDVPISVMSMIEDQKGNFWLGGA